MHTIITSDVHLGSRHADVAAFSAFLDALPPTATLVLNGDILNHYHHEDNLNAAHAATLDRIIAISLRQPVVWLCGNNDPVPRLAAPHHITFAPELDIGTLHIEHGHRFDRIMPRVRPFLYVIKRGYDFLEALCGGRRHIANAAKCLDRLYHVFTRHVAHNAVVFARQHGATTVTCGHTHYAEDQIIDGIRYINTGAWTEPARLHLDVRDAIITVIRHPAKQSAQS